MCPGCSAIAQFWPGAVPVVQKQEGKDGKRTSQSRALPVWFNCSSNLWIPLAGLICLLSILFCRKVLKRRKRNANPEPLQWPPKLFLRQPETWEFGMASSMMCVLVRAGGRGLVQPNPRHAKFFRRQKIDGKRIGPNCQTLSAQLKRARPRPLSLSRTFGLVTGKLRRFRRFVQLNVPWKPCAKAWQCQAIWLKYGLLTCSPNLKIVGSLMGVLEEWLFSWLEAFNMTVNILPEFLSVEVTNSNA